MSISDKDRKILWGRSGSLCAICKVALVVDETATDAEAVVGDEAHIAARSPNGPRYGECSPDEVDAYDNLILLCKIDHKIVDDQYHEFTTDQLRRIKAEHESWVKLRLRVEGDEPEPDRTEVNPDAPPLRLRLLRTGGDVWDVVSSSHAYRLGDLDEVDAEPEQLDAAAEFLHIARDWGEVSSDVIDRGMVAVREAKASLSDSLRRLGEHDLVVFGACRRLIVKGGLKPSEHWYEATLEVVWNDDPRIVEEQATP